MNSYGVMGVSGLAHQDDHLSCGTVATGDSGEALERGESLPEQGRRRAFPRLPSAQAAVKRGGGAGVLQSANLRA